MTYFEDEAATTTGPETHQTQADFAQFLRLYDEETRRFIVSEQSRPYVALAMRLAQQEAEPDVPTLLQIIAQFMREQKQEYRAHP
ncbi:hypothetical protein GCM10025857_28760 [Alicyclobacillus contaminans]|nr:hypothetical protein GCM10025857_28760 [Alicyclobacillus contaminans]